MDYLLAQLLMAGAALGILLALIFAGVLGMQFLERFAQALGPSDEEREAQQSAARDAFAECAALFDGELASGSEARIEGRLRGDPVEMTYIEVSNLFVLKLWGSPAFTGGALEFEGTKGLLGRATWSGPGRRRARELSAGPAFSELLALLWSQGWKSLSLEAGALVLRGSLNSGGWPSPEEFHASLHALQRIGVLCETGGLLLSAQGKGVPICPYCRDLLEGAGESPCLECATRMHTECWVENAGCVVYGCSALGAGRRRQDDPGPPGPSPP